MKKKILITIFSIIGVLVVSIVGYGIYVYNNLTNTADQIHKPIDRQSTKRSGEVNLNNKDSVGILLLGVDQRPGDRGRSDTMIYVTVNPKTNSAKMISIPRDTRTLLVGRNTQDKINHAYAFGGVKMSMDSVEHLLDVPVDYYVQVNMESFKDIVDAVGGVDVNSSFSFNYDGAQFQEGNIHLDGEKALKYVRMRYEDPQGDFGRQERQRQVIQGIVDKAISLNTITKVDDILKSIGNNVQTNLTLEEMQKFQKDYATARNNIETLQLKGQGTKIDRVYYFIPDETSLNDVQQTLKTSLE
ncbi:LCP family glycopolymer transferase [Massilibacterium senegalense]|uniref:LCP family glycopolymer transferase n=1 Tax=Massilibacterium senegalense TaxID=1632858 RepID=UPI00078407A1|nr:LCP family protein [Massilibacterium senegalense]